MVRQISIVCLVLVVALTGAVFAQGTQTGTLSGTVTGPDGTPLPGVTVTASSPAQLGEKTAVTGTNGDYIIRGLTPGEYKVTFHLEGMQALDRTVTAQLGQTTRVDAGLRMTTAAETIVVTGEAPSALETTTVGANITKEQVDQLPVVRTPTGIADLAGAVTSRTPVGGQVSINGGMAYDNSILVNGVNVQDPIFGSTNNLFIEDAILETQILTSGISAEYGAFTGGVLNVITKSGGNEFSGALRGDFTKPEWRDETPWEEGFRGDGAARAAAAPRKGDLGEVYSVTLGGPFVRDRLWFFGAMRDEENTNPAPTAVSGNIARVVSNRRLEGKLTGNITANHTLQASYISNPVEATHEIQVAPLTLDAIGLNSKRENEGTVINYNGVLTNSLFAEARWSEKKFGFRGLGGTSENIFDSPIRALAGFHTVPSFGTFNAPYFDATDPEDRNNESLYGAMSYFLGTQSMGSHDIKGGVERFTVTRTGGNSQTSTDYVFYTEYNVDAAGAPVVTNGRLVPRFIPVSECTNVACPDGYSIMGWWVATRGAVLDVTTNSFFINDRWDFNPNWSFNLGVRHEIVDSQATGEITPIDTTSTVPRLGLSFDPLANGRFKFDVTYAQYSGRYNPAITGENTPVGNPASLFGYYVGPAGSGRDFAPGFDPANYVIYEASVPTLNNFIEDGLTSPTQNEYTLSAGMALPKGGWFKATFIDRELTGVIDDFIDDFSATGCTDIVFEGAEFGCFDNVTFRNTDGPKREYQAIELQSRYSIRPNWSIEGNYTHQLKNDGNYEGEGGQAIGATAFGDRPEIASPRNNPLGRLSQYQKHKFRAWTNYNINLGRFGTLGSGLIWRYDSPETHSFTRTVAFTPTQLARNPGYRNAGGNQTLFFGERGAGEFNEISQFDLSLTYGIPVFRRVEPWVKFDVKNLLNDHTMIRYNTTITQAGPNDADGLPTTFTKAAAFGRPTANTSFTVPREYLISAGIRF
jgi:outer membrane receptor protein involved in Fe transport